MSDQAALTPLHHVIPTGKKRKGNFRPTSLKNVKAVNKRSSEMSPTVPREAEEEQEEDEVPSDSEFNNEPEEEEEVEQEVVTAEPLSKASSVVRPRTRPKKSKKIAISVGPVRPADSSHEALEATEMDTQMLPSSRAPSSVVTARFQVEDTSAMDEMDEAILSKEQGDLPKLNAFCSRFKVKRKPKGAAGREVGTAAAPHREHRIHDTRDLPNSNNNNNAATAGPVVQIVNGEIVLQESSVVINRANAKMGEEDASVVEEEAQLAVVGATANSFTNRNKSQRWTADQTRLFYQALRQVGTDFGTMEAFFSEKRTRKQLKRKYQAELIRNPRLIEKALDPSIRADLGKFVVLRTLLVSLVRYAWIGELTPSFSFSFRFIRFPIVGRRKETNL